MSLEADSDPRETLGHSATHLVQVLTQFLRLVWYRRKIVIAALVVSFLLGGLYYATATRYYQSSASLLVLSTGKMVWDSTHAAEGDQKTVLMPTYQRLFSSAVVLEGALARLAPEHRVDLQGVPQDQWIDVLRSNLSTSVVRQTNMLTVSYRSKDKASAVAVVNALVESYLKFMERTHQGAAAEIIQILTKEQAALDGKLVAKEHEILQTREQYQILGIKQGDTVVHPLVKHAMEMKAAVTEAQKERVRLQASLAAVQLAIRRGGDLHHHLLGVQDVVGREFLAARLGLSNHDALLQARLEQEMIADRAKLQTLLKDHGPNHGKCVEVINRIRTAEDYLRNYRAEVGGKLAEMESHVLGPLLVQVLEQSLGEAWQREMSLAAAYDEARREAVGLNGQLAQLEMLENDLKWMNELREVMLKQIANYDLRQNQSDIRTAVVEEPTIGKRPVWPRLIQVMGLCLVAGLAVGLSAVYVTDVLDDHFRSPEELQGRLQVPVLAMIRQLEPLEGTAAEGVHLHVAPEASDCEAFRTLRTTLTFSAGQVKRLVASSAEPADGKTTVLVNLATAYAQAGQRTLLIDADLRRPGLTAWMELRGAAGLSDVLGSDQSIREQGPALIQPTGIAELDLLPSGLRPTNPAELLVGGRLAELLAWAETVYDYVLIDAPPVLAASDAAIIGRQVDGVMLVVQPEKNQRRTVVRAAEAFRALGINLLGVVVNRVGSQKGSQYAYHSDYGYEYNGYGQSNEGDVEQTAGEPPPVPGSEPLPDAAELTQRQGESSNHRRAA